MDKSIKKTEILIFEEEVEDINSFTNGTFVRPATGVRVNYKRIVESDADKSGRIKITIDGRKLSEDDKDKWHEDKHINSLKVDVSKDDEPIHCLLSIDLGNSRTMATLIDGYKEKSFNQNYLNFYPVVFRHDGRDNRKKDSDGSLNSVISFVNPEAFDEECRLSFVKIGLFAEYNTFKIDDDVPGIYILSSPKRYFWDNDPESRGWKAVAENDNTAELKSLFASKLNKEKLSKANMLSGMIAEIYEQALYYLYNDFPKEARKDPKHQRCISAIHVTYPSTLDEYELKTYHDKLKCGIDTYSSFFSGQSVELRADIDEASSVLILYIYSEIRKAKLPNFWLKRDGREMAEGYAMRIASIDIGGGTSDISIAQVSNQPEIDSMQAKISLLLNFGINKAGELLLYNLLKNDLVVRAIRVLNPDWNADKVRLEYNRIISSLSDTGLTREINKIWRDLAIDAICAYENNKETVAARLMPDKKMRRFWENLFDVDEDGLEGKELITINLDDEFGKVYKEVAKEVFWNTARLFARFIAAYDVDKVVFAGKTMELKAVKKIFIDELALPQDNMVDMNDYYAGDWYKDSNGHYIRDSKQATTLGGALLMLKDGNYDLEFSNDINKQEFEWGKVIHNNTDVFDVPIFKNGETLKKITFSSVDDDFLVARKLKFKDLYNCCLSFQIRFKKDIQKNKRIIGHAEIEIELDNNNSIISIHSVSGSYVDGTPIKKDDLECRICSMTQDSEFDRTIEI